MILRDGAVLLGALLAGTVLAAAFGATNLGTALTFGTIAFLVAVLALMLFPKDR
ncbi:MAG TPA: hypothetical protein VF549_05940 [Solirubrobacteraceae bacterium]|jgi:hypothetical protein